MLTSILTLIRIIESTESLLQIRRIDSVAIVMNRNGRQPFHIVQRNFNRHGTGFGITLIGPADSDLALLDAADAYLAAADLSSPPPLDLEGKMQTVKLAVVGAHLKDMPLHWQLTSRDATFVGAFERLRLRLPALPGVQPILRQCWRSRSCRIT